MSIIHAAENAEALRGFPWWGYGLVTFSIFCLAAYAITRYNPDR